jgi:outer membrane receptor protein involved in Fe transport
MKRLLVLILILATSFPLTAQHRDRPQTRAEVLEKANDVHLFSGVDGVYFDLESDRSSQGALAYRNILSWLQGRVAGLQVYYRRGIPIAYIRNYPAALYLDEMRIDAATLDMIPVSDIALVKVMKGPVSAAWGSPGGTIAVYTKRGAEED